MGATEDKVYIYYCDEPGCSGSMRANLVSGELTWLFLDKDGNGVPATCYCYGHRSAHE